MGQKGCDRPSNEKKTLYSFSEVFGGSNYLVHFLAR